ncbi:MAG: hypothetical protein OXG09_01580 [Chloroflexi bacterium]|nr:hypothetical protein [Chloroflexota bacterium]
MAVLVWSESDGALGNIVRSGRRVMLSAEEFREEAEALDAALDETLDMAWSALAVIAKDKNGKLLPTSFEQVWTVGRAVWRKGMMYHEAMKGEVRHLLWEALAHKCWFGVRADVHREPRWQELLPKKMGIWQTKPREAKSYKLLEIGYWLREHHYHEAGELFQWNLTKAQDYWDRAFLRSPALRTAVLAWLREQPDSFREQLKAGARGKGGARALVKALAKRFPARGPGSARLPQHYPTDQLQAIVDEVLDAARDEHFAEHDARA